MNFRTFHWEIYNKVGILTLENTSANILNRKFFADFQALTAILEGLSEQLKGILVTSQGRHFSCGADLAEISQYKHLFKTRNDLTEYFKRNSDAIVKFRSLPIPKLALVKGVCLGAGLELALACTYIVGSKKVMMGFPEISFGLMPGWSGMRSAVDRLGRGKALEMILSGRNYTADEALEMNLIDEVTQLKDGKSLALERLDELSKNVNR